MRWEKLSTRGATTDWQSRLEPSVYTAASSSVVRDLYVQMACRHRYACAMWVDDWQECHAIVCQQPQERTPADVERLAIWLRTKSPLFQDLNEEAMKEYANQVVTEPHQKGSLVCLQGEECNRFYCILRGSVSLMVDPSYNSSIGMLTNSTLPVTTSHSKTTDDKAAFKKHKSHGIELGLLSAGEYFGHIASLHHDKRTSFSALANEYTELLTIENHVFQEVLLDIFQAKLLHMATFLSHQHFFMLWSATQLASLCLNLTEKKMAMGECIYGQGKEVKEIFIIKSGSVRILLDSSMQVPELIFQRIKPPTDYVAKLLESDRKKEAMQLRSLQEKAKPKSKREPSATESRISSASVQATKHVQGQNPVMHCRLHEPLNSSPLCVLLPGEFLSGIEVLSGLKQHLFTAVCCSDVELYGMNTILFNHLFPKHGCSTTATEMLQYHIEQVTEWNARHPQVELFSPLLILLQQQLSQCLKCCSKKSGRGRLWRSSDTLADCIMSAIMKKSV